MIKVNLLKDTRGGKKAGTSVGAQGSQLSQDDQIRFVIRVVIIVLMVGLVYGYEKFMINKKLGERSEIQAETNNINRERQELGDIGALTEKKLEEIKKIQAEIDGINIVFHRKVRDVRFLSEIQNLMPEKIWFSSLLIDGSTGSVSGFSDVSESIPLFLQKIESLSYIRTITPGATSEESGTIQKFSFEFQFTEGAI